MKTTDNKNILISGASMAGLSTAHLMTRLGYKVTIVEMAPTPRTAGAAVDIKEKAVDIVKHMGLFEKLSAHGLHVRTIEFKNTDDITEGSISLGGGDEETPNEEIEIERDKFVQVLMDELKNDVEFIFNDNITALHETTDDIHVTFKNSPQRSFHLVLGCDGIHSGVRNIWFGHEAEYTHFLEAYSAITIVNKLLVSPSTMQAYNVPCKAVMLNAYNNKTDIIFCFLSEKEIPYDYRNLEQQRNIILEKFSGEGWRVPELLQEVKTAGFFYFDKFCQIKMPSWTKGRVALIGDAAYCASPAAGMGASLAIAGAGALADALQKHNGDFLPAFAEYNKNLRPHIEEVQTMAERNIKENFILRTEEAIRKRNTEPSLW